jgi:hypothetical protein
MGMKRVGPAVLLCSWLCSWLFSWGRVGLLGSAAWAGPGAGASGASKEHEAGPPHVVESFGELRVDFSAGTVEVPGVGVPSLHAPSAQVGRSEAERKARRDALLRLKKELSDLPAGRLGCESAGELPGLEAAVAEATPSKIDWGSDGSVRLMLRVRLGALAAKSPPDAGSSSGILIDGVARPALFSGKRCAMARPGPRVFETLPQARALAPELTGLPLWHSRSQAAGAEIAAIVRRSP